LPVALDLANLPPPPQPQLWRIAFSRLAALSSRSQGGADRIIEQSHVAYPLLALGKLGCAQCDSHDFMTNAMRSGFCECHTVLCQSVATNTARPSVVERGKFRKSTAADIGAGHRNLRIGNDIEARVRLSSWVVSPTA